MEKNKEAKEVDLGTGSVGLDKIYITIICYLSFLPNNEK